MHFERRRVPPRENSCFIDGITLSRHCKEISSIRLDECSWLRWIGHQQNWLSLSFGPNDCTPFQIRK